MGYPMSYHNFEILEIFKIVNIYMSIYKIDFFKL